jgi:membrane-associated phospholipid phosphatase
VATIYLASIVFLLCPVEPPWMEIGSVRVLEVRAFIEYTGVDTNQVAAMPSLHAGLPAMLGLFALVRLGWRKTAYALFAYSAGVGFFVVYLGEHWVIDVVAGWALAGFVAFVLTRGAMYRAVNALPGHPLTALARFNRYWFPEPVRRLEPVVPETETEVRRAA